PLANQPTFISPWLYNFMSKPSLTQEKISEYRKVFKNTPDGIPTNDDAGSTSSWYIFSAIGLYPLVPGVGGFTVTSPLFDSITIELENGEFIQIDAPNASDNIYIKQLK